MPLSFAAIAPHSPLLISSIAKENHSRLEKTLNSYKKAESFIAAQKTETIIILSPHGKTENDQLTLNLAPKLSINFEEFGDFSSKSEIETDLETAEAIRQELLEKTCLKATNQKVPDFGAGVPLYLLTKNQKNLEAVIINSSTQGIKQHFEIGTVIGKILEKSKKNISLIASADLSHCLNKKSPAGYSPKGQKFDLRLMDLINEKRIDDLLNLDEKTIEEAKSCGLKTILLLFGILFGAGADWKMATSTYEAPFGIGYLTASLEIK
jgi:aromatic ring-opening dioxygenase LigB subunit